MSSYSQYYAVNPLASKDETYFERPSFTKTSIEKNKQASRGRPNLSQNMTELKYEQIKRKYGSKERNTSELYQSNALQEITLRHSNYTSLLRSEGKNINSAEKCIESRINNFRDVNPTQPFLLYQKSGTRQDSVDISHNPSSINKQSRTMNLNQSYLRNTRINPSFIERSVDRHNPESTRRDNENERVGSIDKINMKIYQIINTLNENSEQRNTLRVIRPTEQEEKQSKSIPPNFGQKVETKATEQTNIAHMGTRGSRQTEISLDKTRRYSVNSYYDPSKGYSRNNIATNGQRSRNREDSILKDRDIDEQIRRIQQRIKKTEEEKKKLNISSQQWTDISIPRRMSLYSKPSEKSSVLLERKNRLYNNNIMKHLGTEQNEKLSVSISKVSVLEKRSQTPLEESLKPNIVPSIKVSPPEEILCSKVVTTRAFKQSKCSKTNFHQQPLPSAKTETKRLIEQLKNQVTYDQYLRNAKVLISQMNNPNKYNNIQQILAQRGIQFSIEQVKKQMQLTPEEHNPFFSVRESIQPLEQLLNKYIDSYLYWKNEVKGKLNLKTLQKEGFSEQKIDLQKKGTLNVEDLVRFLNIETGNFYRNRDVILLFRRITSNPSTTFKQMMDVLCFQ